MAFTKTPRTLEFDNQVLTLSQWSEALGIPLITIRKRLARELPTSEVLQVKQDPPQDPNRSILVTHNGVSCPIRQHALQAGLDPDMVFLRLQRGADLTEALSRPTRDYNRKLSYAGQDLTISQWAHRLGISASCIYQRISSGKTIPEALKEEG